jgi:O-antigen/teichoic acid export membrane protein
MIQTFIKDSFIYSIPIIISRGLGIILLPIYTRITSAEELGALELFFAFGNLAMIIITLEISQAIARFIPELPLGKKRNEYSSSGFIFTFLSYLFFASLFFSFSNELALLITGVDYFNKEFEKVILYIFTSGIFYYLQNLLRFEGKSGTYAFISILYACLNLFITAILGLVFFLGFDAILYSLIISNLTVMILAMFALRHSLSLQFSIHALRELFFFSFPLIPASIFVFLSLYIDRIMISSMLGLDAAGLYAVALRLSSVFAIIIVGFRLAILPLIYKNQSAPNTPQDLSVIFRNFVALALIFFISYSFLVDDVVKLLTSPLYFGITSIIPILTVAICFANINVFMPGAAIKKKTHIIMWISLLVSIINFLMNFLLIPQFGILGAALATAFGYTIGFICHSYFSQQLYFVPHEWPKYIANLLAAFVVVIIYFFIKHDLETLASIVFRLIGLTVLILIMIKTQLIRVDELRNIYFSLTKKTSNE